MVFVKVVGIIVQEKKYTTLEEGAEFLITVVKVEDKLKVCLGCVVALSLYCNSLRVIVTSHSRTVVLIKLRL